MTKTEETIPAIWTMLWTDALNTGTWRSALPVYQNRLSPCHLSCPLRGAIPAWIEKIKKAEYHEAWLKVVEDNPFPAITGRVCHHPCEGACNRSYYDEKLSVKLLERYIGDLALQQGWPFPARQAVQNKTVAVVGAGPAGLSAAYQLYQRGYAVEIFEARPKPGGLLRYGIPDYRLPKAILEGELARFTQLGITVHSGTLLATADEYSRLRRDYDALFLAMGAQRPQKLPQLESEPGLLYDGLDFLSQVNEGRLPRAGKHVAVIGGGNTAVDAARVARRLGAAEVTLVYRRTREQMPCQPSEIHEASEEGVNFIFLAAPVKITVKNGTQQLICQKMRLGGKDTSGRPYPEPIEDAYIPLEVDKIVVATGAAPDLGGLADGLGVRSGTLTVGSHQETSAAGVFAGGDLTAGERFVSNAIGDGKKAAESIALYLKGLAPAVQDQNTAVAYAEINTFYFPKNHAVRNYTLEASQRLHNFKEVQQGISPEEAAIEAGRCFVCGQCLLCDNCFYYCPDMAIKRDNRDAEGYTVLDQYCKGCGLCVKECPRGALVLKEETL